MHSNDSDDFFYFILENTMILGQKLRNLRLIPSEEFFFLHPRISDNFFCPTHKVLESHDLSTCHKIWAKLHRPQFFLAGTPMSVRDSAYSDMVTLS